jgi:hypothetical protein
MVMYCVFGLPPHFCEKNNNNNKTDSWRHMKAKKRAIGYINRFLMGRYLLRSIDMNHESES